MMRPRQNCPSCGEDELYISRNITWISLHCPECGWNYTIMPRPAEDALDAAIAVAISAAKTTREADDA